MQPVPQPSAQLHLSGGQGGAGFAAGQGGAAAASNPRASNLDRIDSSLALASATSSVSRGLHSRSAYSIQTPFNIVVGVVNTDSVCFAARTCAACGHSVRAARLATARRWPHSLSSRCFVLAATAAAIITAGLPKERPITYCYYRVAVKAACDSSFASPHVRPTWALCTCGEVNATVTGSRNLPNAWLSSCMLAARMELAPSWHRRRAPPRAPPPRRARA